MYDELNLRFISSMRSQTSIQLYGVGNLLDLFRYVILIRDYAVLSVTYRYIVSLRRAPGTEKRRS